MSKWPVVTTPYTRPSRLFKMYEVCVCVWERERKREWEKVQMYSEKGLPKKTRGFFIVVQYNIILSRQHTLTHTHTYTHTWEFNNSSHSIEEQAAVKQQQQ